MVLRYVNEQRPTSVPFSPIKMTPDGYAYFPLLYVDEMALRKGQMVEVGPPHSQGRPKVKFQLKFVASTLLRHRISSEFAKSMDLMSGLLQSIDGVDQIEDDLLDEIRYMVSDRNLYRFVLSNIISLVHLLLSTLAFKNEIGFYVGRSDMKGLSATGLISSFVSSLIIFLYLCDGSSTSKVVLYTVGMEVLIDAWKLKKILRPKIVPHFPFFAINDPADKSEGERVTNNYDRIATKNITIALLPLLVGAGIYSLRKYRYRGWYSFMISHLANCVYMFGFIKMCPQVYINYRLKSVSHLPTRMFVYKIFNTFGETIGSRLHVTELCRHFAARLTNALFMSSSFLFFFFLSLLLCRRNTNTNTQHTTHTHAHAHSRRHICNTHRHANEA